MTMALFGLMICFVAYLVFTAARSAWPGLLGMFLFSISFWLFSVGVGICFSSFAQLMLVVHEMSP